MIVAVFAAMSVSIARLNPTYIRNNEQKGAFWHITERSFVILSLCLLVFGWEYEITNAFPHYLLDYRDEACTNERWADRIVSESGTWSENVIDFYLDVAARLLSKFVHPFTTDPTGTNLGATDSVTEAVNGVVANALVHAYYGSTGSVKVVMQSGVMEVSNPGTFLVDRSVAISGGTSELRNPALMRIFNFIGAVDRAGSGLQMVYETWKREFGAMPEIVESHQPARVVVSLPVVARVHKYLPSREGFTDASILAFAGKRAGGVTSAEVAEVFGVSLSAAQKRLRVLSETDGPLRRRKAGHGYVYLSGNE